MSDALPAAPTGAALARPFTRRTLLAAALAGTAVTVAGCTGDAAGGADAVTPAQVDQLAAQVTVQASLVAAYDQALAAAPELAATAAVLAEQARAQLDRLRAAAPGSTDGSSSGSSPAASSVAPVPTAGVREYLRGQVSAAADSHAAACPAFTGARAALLGSIAAGLRGQDRQLA